MDSFEHSVEPGRFNAYGVYAPPVLTPELLSLVKTGTVYSLSLIYREGIPVPGPMVPYTLTPRIRHGDLDDLRPASAAAEVITMAVHTATHIDALCHIGERQDDAGEPSLDGPVRLYDSAGRTVDAADHVTYQGQKHFSIAEMPPILTRGIVLDVAGFKGVPVLPPAYPITVRDIQGTLEKQGCQMLPGTAVLVRTGYYKHLQERNTAYENAIAGIDLDAAHWLVEQGMTLAGADTMTVEALPPMDHRVHRYLIVHNGMTLLENLFLEKLVVQSVSEFLLIVTPLRLVGATGSWVHPIAIA
ncbi:MAG: cyclase family protein [Chloroflexi bacterium]|nr:cyclase family protein [Chloroflexota bacterium]